MNPTTYEFDAITKVSEIDKGGSYVVFPYDGSVVNMGLKDADGNICYIIGIRKDIRAKIGKNIGDTVRVTVKERV